MIKSLLIPAFILAASGAPVWADEVRQEAVHFAAGESGATINGTVQGYDSVEYTLGASAGQTMAVTLRPTNPSASFNIFAPGTTPGEDEAMFIGSGGEEEFLDTLPADGEYRIQVYLYRNAARDGKSSDYVLEIGIN